MKIFFKKLMYWVVNRLMLSSGFSKKFKCGETVKFNWMSKVRMPVTWEVNKKVLGHINMMEFDGTYVKFDDLVTGQLDGADEFWLRRLYWWEKRPMSEYKGLTYVGWANVIFFQWFFVRLVYSPCIFAPHIIEEWSFLKGVVPCTGWSTPYKFINEKPND